MPKRLNALVLFSKLPVPGEVKTRLSVLKDGMFSPEDASELFCAMLLDVIDTCLDAFDLLEGEAGSEGALPWPTSLACNCEHASLSNVSPERVDMSDEYRLYISTAPSANVSAMRKLVEENGIPTDRISFIGDKGSSFDEHYNDAFEQVWSDGADCILSMGADMPALSSWDVVRGFQALHFIDGVLADVVGSRTFDNSREPENGSSASPYGHGQGIVISPDQEMGVSIIGWTKNTKFDHTGVFYNASGLTVLPAYIEKARKANIAAIALPPVPDVDTIADLSHNITLLQAAEYTSRFDGSNYARRTIEKLKELGCYEVRVPPNELRDSRDVIDA